mgnify:CR=1 FL=1
MKPIRIIIHHTANETQEPQLKLTDNYHKQEGFPKSSLGYYVGYTYFVERDGTTTQTRIDTEEQAHTKEFNFNSIGICLAGNFDKEQPTTTQRHKLRELIKQNRQVIPYSIRL